MTADWTSEYPSEHYRIQFLIARDGIDAAKKWCARTAGIYRIAVAQDGKPEPAAAAHTKALPTPWLHNGAVYDHHHQRPEIRHDALGQ